MIINNNIQLFKDFLEENQIVSTVIATIISTYITNLSVSFIDNLIIPLFEIDINNDGKNDLNGVKNLKISIFNSKFKIGEVILDILKFLIITYIMFAVNNFYKKYKY